MTEISKRLEETVAWVRANVSKRVPRIGIVLGSGLGSLVDEMKIDRAVPYAEIPGFPASTVSGHAGRLVLGTLADVSVAVMQGRVHLYEGYPASSVVFPTRVLVKLGIETLIVTNAAGCLNTSWNARELMLLSDHLNLTGTSSLLGPNDPALGPRFPDMSEPYDRELAKVTLGVAREKNIVLREGVYAGLLGPSYETPAEIRMLRTLGADAVGMSTVLETIAARHMGVKVLGISCLSNMAAGLSKTPLSHEEVKEAADAIQADFTRLLTATVDRISHI